MFVCPQDDQLKEIIDKAREMEDLYWNVPKMRGDTRVGAGGLEVACCPQGGGGVHDCGKPGLQVSTGLDPPLQNPRSAETLVSGGIDQPREECPDVHRDDDDDEEVADLMDEEWIPGALGEVMETMWPMMVSVATKSRTGVRQMP